jgi:hypothetical protein
MLNMRRYSINNSLLSCLDYKVVNVILMINITKWSCITMEWQQQASITHIRECCRDSNQFTPCKGEPDNMTHTRPPRPHMQPQFMMTIKESGRALPHPSACLPRDTSLGYPWVAHTLSWCTSCRCDRVSSNSVTVEATKFVGPYKSRMCQYIIKLVHRGQAIGP